MVKFIANHDFDIPTLDDGQIVCDSSELQDYRANSDNIVPLLFQSGYLTIKRYDSLFRAYILGFPNNEVCYAFLNCLIKEYTKDIVVKNSAFSIYSFIRLIQNGKVE